MMGGSFTEKFVVIRRMERRSHGVARSISRLAEISGNGGIIVIRIVGWGDGIVKGRDVVVVRGAGVVVMDGIGLA